MAAVKKSYYIVTEADDRPQGYEPVEAKNEVEAIKAYQEMCGYGPGSFDDPGTYTVYPVGDPVVYSVETKITLTKVEPKTRTRAKK